MIQFSDLGIAARVRASGQTWWAAFGTLTVTFVLLVYVVPFLVPVPEASISLSANVGYNNQVALLVVLTGLAVLTWLARWPPRAIGRPPSLELPIFAMQRAWPERGWIAWLMGGALALHAAIVVGAYTLTIDPGIAEATFFLRRTDRILAGASPYADFHYTYGPLLAYPPAWLATALARFGGGSKEGYYLFLLALTQASMYAGFLVCFSLPLGSAGRQALFLIFVAASLPISMGLNGVPLRFIGPFVLVLLLERLRLCEQADPPAVPPIAAATGLATSVVVLMLLISPEIGLATTLGLMTYGGALVWQSGRHWLPLVLVPPLVGLLTGLLEPDPALSVLGRAGGGFAFPVLPSPFTLLYLVALLVSVPLVVAAFLNGQRMAPGWLGFTAVAVAMSPAVLARPDPPHVFNNGFGVLLLALALASVLAPVAGRRLLAVYALVLGLLLPASNLYAYHLSLGKHVVDHLARHVEPARLLAWLEGAGMPEHLLGHARARLSPPPDYSFLDRVGRVAVPFPPDAALYGYLVDHDQRWPLFFDGFHGVYDRSAVARLLAELEHDPPPFVLLHEAHWPIRRSPIFHAQTIAHDHLSYLLMTPSIPAAQRDSRDLLIPLDAYLERNYTSEFVGDGYIFLRRRSSDPARPAAPIGPSAAFMWHDQR